MTLSVLARYELQQRLMFKVGDKFNPSLPTKYLGTMYWRFGDTVVAHCQDGYLAGVVKDLGLESSKSVNTPGVKMREISKADAKYVGAERHKSYRGAVGKLQFALPRRPDYGYELNNLVGSFTNVLSVTGQRSNDLGGTSRAP